MIKQKKSEYFLGANSVNGFYSKYDDLVDPSAGDKLYVIKSGPGSGKSSFMRNIASKMAELNHKVEYIYCSGDPESLDAVYFPELKTAIVDGTSPHVIEPNYPAVCDVYLDLGKFYDFEAIQEKKSEIMSLFAGYKSHYKNAYDYLNKYKYLTVANGHDLSDYSAAISKKVKFILKKYGLETISGSKYVYHKSRFVSAFTYNGQIELASEFENYENAVFIISSCGLDSLFCKAVKDFAETNNISTISYLNPLFPEKIDHIALPELSLIIISKSALLNDTISPKQTVSLDNIVDRSCLKKIKSLNRAFKRPSAFLLSLAQEELVQAKALHDTLEKAYNPYVDFDSVYSLSDKYFDKILNSPDHL